MIIIVSLCLDSLSLSHTQMKILISLISMNRDIRSSNTSSIKRLLSAACNDKDEVTSYCY